jgi:pilus assembly protein Flp/PilA
MKSTLVSFVADESGATAIEYALIAGGISIAILTTVGLIGGQLNTLFATVVTVITAK